MSGWDTKRTEPYTTKGIARLKCIRCGGKGWSTWNICSDNGYFRPLCVTCDVELNALVLEWVKHPRAGELADAYARQALARAELRS